MLASDTVRSDILDYLITQEEDFYGKLGLLEFLGRIWDLGAMPSTDYRFNNAYQDIHQHCVFNDDWDKHYLFYTYLELTKCDDTIFFKFLETCLHPLVLPNGQKQKEKANAFNDILKRDNFVLQTIAQIAGKPIYKVTSLKGGVHGNVKNLIFAAKGAKPEIVFRDSISNDIQIVKNAENCLIYYRPISESGLLWTDLIAWWSEEQQLTTLTKKEQEIHLYKRLYASLDSMPEQLLFRTYFEHFKPLLGDALPALIPQVYLHYDPYTFNQLHQGKDFVRQRMDFLMLFSNHDRIVLEIDGIQHYSENNTAKPNLYADMVAEDRKLRLAGYELYRFGGYELYQGKGKKITTDFFHMLFRRHSIQK